MHNQVAAHAPSGRPPSHGAEPRSAQLERRSGMLSDAVAMPFPGTIRKARGRAPNREPCEPGLSMRPRVVACIPAKGLDEAKSRLGLPASLRTSVARRLLYSTVLAVTDSDWISRVVVVAGDRELAAIALAAGAEVVLDQNRSLTHAVDLGRRTASTGALHEWMLTLVADLPLLVPAEIDALVVEGLTSNVPVMVPDKKAVGTTCLFHPSREGIPTHFGDNSAMKHREAGFRTAGLSLDGLRSDLDRPDDLLALPRIVSSRLLFGGPGASDPKTPTLGGMNLCRSGGVGAETPVVRRSRTTIGKLTAQGPPYRESSFAGRETAK